jgi:hypothetical protein
MRAAAARKQRSAATARRRSGARKSKHKAAKVGATPTVLLVNLIPKSLSGESNQDSEPTIAVNPANPLQIAASAFTPDPQKGAFAPIFVSTDGGTTWLLNAIVPGADHLTGTSDITLQFSQRTNVLYAGILRGDSSTTRLNILRSRNFAARMPMELLVDRTDVDQPYVQVAMPTAGPGKGKDRVYVGNNDTGVANGRTATIDACANAAAPGPRFTKIRIESRDTPGQDGPPVRPALHHDGTAYAIYHSWRSFDDRTGEGTADIVVLRDDGRGPKPFSDLVDPADRKTGVRVARGTKFNFNGYLGLQRTGGDVALAVDPTDSDAVYIAYNDDHGSDYMLHVLRSTDRGQTWSADLRTLRNALNPALAINKRGQLAFLYQQLTGTGAAQRWVTKLELTVDAAKWTMLTLATTPANVPPRKFDPYLGDYAHLMAVGRDFYGIFSASNVPKKSNFPLGVIYQRNANWTTGTLLAVDQTTPVHVSIDPFFFKVSA